MDIPLLAFDPQDEPLESNRTRCNVDLTRVLFEALEARSPERS